MARIPLQIASRGLETGSPVSYSGASPIGQALEGFGNALGNVADHQRLLADRAQAQRDDVENFETTQRFQQLKIAADTDRIEIGKSAPASGMGFHDKSVAAFDKRRDEFLGSVPERLKPRMEALLGTERAQFSQQVAGAEYEQRSSWYRTGLETSIGRGQEQVFNDPAALEAAKQEAIREVDASGLPEIEKEEWRKKVRVGLTQSLAARTLQDDPEGLSRSLGVALPQGNSMQAQLGRGKQIASYFEGKGLSKVAAAGIAGALVQENGGRFDGKPGDGGKSFGAAQWNGERLDGLKAFAGSRGTEWTDGQTQLDYVLYEMENGDAGARRAGRELMNATTAEEAADAMMHFERPSGYAPDNPRGGHGYDNRKRNAETILGQGTRGVGSENIPVRTRGGSSANLEGVKPLVLDRFQQLQNQWGRAIPINSGHRDAVVNKRSGGADKSQHLHGNALDLDVSEMSKEERSQFIGMASAMGFTGIGVYNNAIHLDMGSRRAWGPTHHGESVPSWAKGAIDAHLAGNGDAAVPSPLAAPGVRLDPRFADLPFADRLKLATDASKASLQRQQAEAVAAQAQYKSQIDSFGLDILTGKVSSENDVLNAGFADDDTATLLRSFRSQQKDANETDTAVRGYIEGTWGSDLNPLDSAEAGIANKVYDKLSEQMEGQPEDVREAATNDFIKRTGVIPRSVEADISLATMSDDPAQIAESMDAAAQVQSLAPKAFASLQGSDGLRKDLASYQHLVNDRGLSGQDAARKLLDRRSPDFKRNEDVLGPEADKQSKDLAVSDVTNSFDQGILSSEPGAGADPTTQNQLLSEYREVFKEEFVANGGDAADAKARANAALSKTWGVSSVSGDSQLMKYPPEKFYPQIKGGFDYIKEDAMQTANELAGYVDAEKPKGTAVAAANGPADLATLRPLKPGEYRDNGDGSYSTEVTATIQDKNGKWVNVPSLWMSEKGWVDLGEDEDAIGTALASYEAKDKPFPRFDTVDQAEAAASARSKTGGIANGSLAGSDGGADVKSVSKIILRPDAGTAADVRAGRPPRYRLFYTREVDGQTVVDQAPKPWAIPTDMLKTRMDTVRAEEDAVLQQQRAEEEESIRSIESFPQRTMDGLSGAAGRVGDAFGAVGNFIAPPAQGSELPAPSGKTARLPRPPAIPGSREAIGEALRQQSREMIDAAR